MQSIEREPNALPVRVVLSFDALPSGWITTHAKHPHAHDETDSGDQYPAKAAWCQRLRGIGLNGAADAFEQTKPPVLTFDTGASLEQLTSLGFLRAGARL